MKKRSTTALLISATAMVLSLTGCATNAGSGASSNGSSGGTTPTSAAADSAVDCSAVASAGVAYHAASVTADSLFNMSSAPAQSQFQVASAARDTARDAFLAANTAAGDKCGDLINADHDWTVARAGVLLRTSGSKADADAALVTAQANWDAAVAAA